MNFDRLKQIIEEQKIDLFHAPDGTAYATFPFKGRRVTARWDDRRLFHLIERRYLATEGKMPSKYDTPRWLAGEAGEGEEHPVFLRVGANEDRSRLYLDLADDKGRVVEITAEDWRVLDQSPIRFVSPPAMFPLPIPEKGGTIDLLRPFIRLIDGEFVLLGGFTLSSLLAARQYPVLGFIGEQGTGKSAATRIVRDLTDPNTVVAGPLPTDVRAMYIKADHEHLLCFNNLTKLSQALSDAIAGITTGSGYTHRRLYTGREQETFYAVRPFILNGITEFVKSPDLDDRCFYMSLLPLPKGTNQGDEMLARDFRAAQPRILGALLDAMAYGLAHLDEARRFYREHGGDVRLADVAIWVTACEPAFGWPMGTFLDAYRANRREAVEKLIEMDPVALAIRSGMNTRENYRATVTQLATDFSMKGDPGRIGEGLRVIAPPLRKVGINITFERDGHAGTRMVRITKTTVSAPAAVTLSAMAKEAPIVLPTCPTSITVPKGQQLLNAFVANGTALGSGTLDDFPTDPGSIYFVVLDWLGNDRFRLEANWRSDEGVDESGDMEWTPINSPLEGTMEEILPLIEMEGSDGIVLTKKGITYFGRLS
jgi:hypothetical protein